MPLLTKISKKMILNSGIEIIRKDGLSSLFANNSMKYDVYYCMKILEDIFEGTLMKIKGEV